MTRKQKMKRARGQLRAKRKPWQHSTARPSKPSDLETIMQSNDPLQALDNFMHGRKS